MCTFECLHLIMNALVSPQQDSSNKGFVADATLVWFLTGVLTTVALQRGGLCETSTAHVTLKRLLASVLQHVSAQVGGMHELRAAHVAVVRLLTGMYPSVNH